MKQNQQAVLLPTYQCHKRVQAARIVSVNQSTGVAGSDGGVSVAVPGQPSFTVPVPLGFFARSVPAVGDYLVVYRDGYMSHSPAAEFEDGYRLVDVCEQNRATVESTLAAEKLGSAPLLSDEGLAHAIAATLGERVTKEYMQSRIATTEYLTLPGTTVTLCNITLDNGYSVRGESACVDPANYRQDIGERIAHDNAFDKLWPLFGFLLAEGRHLRSKVEA
jgi:hypothetical protein